MSDRNEVETQADAVLALIGSLRRDLYPDRPPTAIALDDSLDVDVGLDSLARVELAERVGREFGLRLADATVFECDTPRDLLRALLKARPDTRAPTRALADHVTTRTQSATPERATTLGDMLAWHADAHAGRVHVQFYDDYTDGAVLTYGDLHAGATRVAGALQAHGLLPGERVAIMLPTSREYFLTFYGVVLAGAVPVPVYPPLRRQQLEDHLRRQSRILTSCGASLLVTTHEALAVARLLTAQVETLNGVFDAAQLLREDAAWDTVAVADGDTAFIQYTSGSTGDPKGVVLSHANLLANVRADGHGMAVSGNDVFVSWLPLYHDMGLIGAWLGSLYHGVRLVIMSPLAFLTRPERWLWAIHRHRGTLSAAPNFAYELCARRIDDETVAALDLSCWRIAANGAEPVSAATLDAFCARFGAAGFERKALFPVYGLAECSVGLTFPPPGRGPRIERVDRDALARDGVARPPTSANAAAGVSLVGCGMPLPGHEVRVVDAAGAELPAQREGRVQFRGPSATAGYYNRPDANAKLFDGDWLETGDRGYLDRGELFVTGRSKDVIIRAGRNLYPAELEQAIGDIDGVRQGHVAVFGVHADASATERVVVLAETRTRDAGRRERIRRRIDELAATLLDGPPDDVVLVAPNTVLRTSSGKIRRSACRDLYSRGLLDGGDKAMWQQYARLALAAVVPVLRRLWTRTVVRIAAARAWCAFGILGIAAWLAAWLPLSRAHLWRIAHRIARLAARLAGVPLKVTGAAALNAAGGSVVVVNHQSYLDGIVMLAASPQPLRFLVKADLGASVLLRTPLTRLGVIFVERFDARAGLRDLDQARAALAAGETVAVFPEGTFKRMPGLLPFHLGAFTLAVDAGRPVVPVALSGTRSVLRSRSWLPRPAPVAVTVAAAESPQPAADAWAAAVALRDRVRAAILAHCDEPDLGTESNRVDATA